MEGGQPLEVWFDLIGKTPTCADVDIFTIGNLSQFPGYGKLDSNISCLDTTTPTTG